MMALRRFIILLISSAVFFLLLDGRLETNAEMVLWRPSWTHLLGTDALGRDLFLRVVQGTAMTLLIGCLAILVSALLGIAIGMMSGWRGGAVDILLQRFTEVVTSLPSFVFVTLIVFLFSAFSENWSSSIASVLVMGFAMGLASWTQTARVTRALVLREKALPYIEAARAMGVADQRVLWRHLFPNIAPAVSISLANQFPQFLIFEGFLSFVGLGLHTPLNSWGLLIHDGWRLLSSYPHLILGPGAVIVAILYALQWLLIKESEALPWTG